VAQIIPQLSARDVDAYIAFLGEAFGFEVTEYWRDPGDPEHVNVELALEGAVVGVGRSAGPPVQPRDPSAPHIGLYVLVEDVDQHHERARAAGATIISSLSDQPWGHRMYGAVDPEGHEWGFASQIAGSR
jgi:uncharacterized glyoxalase superfamily protein PhnB